MSKSISIATAILVGLLTAAPAAQAQFSGSGELPHIDAETRGSIVDLVAAVIDSAYVLGEPAELIAAGLRKNLADGEYDQFSDPAEFAQRLQDDAQGIHHDGHFAILVLPPVDPTPAARMPVRDSADEERQRRLDRALNYGFREAKILPGGIAYLRIDRFEDGEGAFEAAAAAMNFVANGNAVILDLRYNGGGSAAMIRFIAGYLFPERTHLVSWDIRAEDRTEHSYSADFVPGRRITDQPVYILTSEATFSAAEEFTFDLRNLGRATVVGETTGGGGHKVAGYMLSFEDFRVLVHVPYARAYNPESGEGWEAIGVTPHIPVSADKALEVAHVDALKKLRDHEQDERIRFAFEWALEDAESRLDPTALAPDRMREYAGQYGRHHVVAEAGALWYQREGRPRHELVPMGEGLFRMADLDYLRLWFKRDGSGRVSKMITLYDDGSTDEYQKDAG